MVPGNTYSPGQFALCHIKGFHKFFTQDFSRMNRRTVCRQSHGIFSFKINDHNKTLLSRMIAGLIKTFPLSDADLPLIRQV
jgi:hypothetical protein